MRPTRSAWLVLAACFLLLTFIGFGLATPAETSARPAYGFTPQPPPPPPPPPDPPSPPLPDRGDSDDRTTDRSKGKDDGPVDYVLVELSRCVLTCPAGASVEAAGGEMLARVQLVHRGSGWISEGVLSDSAPARFSVPYPGQWEVFLVEEPLFKAGPLPETGWLDMTSLRQNLAGGPVFVGLVEANTAGPQLIKCPAACVIDPPPPALPVTGAAGLPALFRLLGGAALLITAGLLLRASTARPRAQ